MVDPWRVAQIAVDRAPGHDGSRGSGYLIAPGRVLTAAHVVAGASVVRVRLDVGQDTEVDVLAESWWADPKGHDGTDLAVVTIAEDATAGRECEPARFGRISDCAAILMVEAFGFPLFKLRADTAGVDQRGVFRDFEQAGGHAPVAANRRQGTLAVYLDDPAPSQPPPGNPSPWEGMSGGPVWTDGRIVAVVAEHHPSEGIGRLTARRIDRAYEELSSSDLGELVELLALAATASGLPDVVPAEQGQLVRSAYLAQVHDIAPDELIGRENELADWAEFCAGADPYTFWQAGPWAGKTALASWFVTHSPAGVDVVSFFITRRFLEHAASVAFLDAMIDQLNALYPAGGASPAVAGARVGAWLNLLASAAAQTAERGRRLVVVVDGLDEDAAGATPSGDEPSIASRLPANPPAGVRFIVTSRPDPGLPDDLPETHLLRKCISHHLAVSAVAGDIELRAKQELRNLLRGDQIGIDVVGYIAGSGGGLTRSDLWALTGAPQYKLEPILGGVAGRSLQTRASTDPRSPWANPATRVYLFAHETLRVTAEEQLGPDLAQYRQKVHEWIASCARLGWPDTTPGYAIRGYPGLLAATADETRLSALARNPGRHAFLLRATGSDYAALSEIWTAQSLISAQGVLDLQALVELAAYRHAISIHNQSTPFDLPIVWARLARFDHAEALARTITSPDAQARALTGLVIVIAQAGNPDRAYGLAADAEALARTITYSGDQAQALIELATAIAQAGDPDRAEALARTTYSHTQFQALTALATAAAQAGDPDRAHRLAADAEALARTSPSAQAWALTGLVTAIAQAGDPERAEALARTTANPDPEAQAQALTALATAAAQAGDPDRAHRLAADGEALARTITDPVHQVQALTAVATAAVQAGDPDRAYRLAADAEALARTITNPDGQAWAFMGLVYVIARAGDPDRAEALARTITSPFEQAQAFTALVIAIAEAGDPDRAELLARTTSPDAQALALIGLVTVIAQAGDPDRAEALARTITGPYAQAQALTALADAAAQTGDPDRAYRLATDSEALARTITPFAQVQALTALATAAAQTGDPDRAYRLAADTEALARTVTGPYAQAQALTALATAAAQTGDPDRAYRLAADAEALARTFTDPDAQAQALTALVTVIAQAGDPDRAYRLATDAEALARTIISPNDRAQALVGLLIAIAQAGDPDRAEALARTITGHFYRAAQALTALVTVIAQAGDPDRAEALARTITDPYAQAEALIGLLTAIAQAGDPDRAEALARTITDPYAQAQALTALATSAAQTGDPDRAYRLAAVAEPLARTITDPYAQAQALIGLLTAIAQAGDPDRAYRLAADAEALARTITDPHAQAEALIGLLTAIAQAGDPDRAEALARTITNPDDQARALTGLATAIAQAGDPDRAGHLWARALVMGPPEISWINTASRLFPSVISSSWNVLVGAYMTRA